MLLCSALPRGHQTGSSADPVHRVLRAGLSRGRSSPCAHRALIASRPAFRTGFLSCPTCFPSPLTVPHRRRQPCYGPASAWERYEASDAVSSEPWTRSARENTRRRCASSKHARLGCRYAPRPGCRAWGSGTIPSPATTRRSKLDFAARALQPTQVRTGFFPVAGSSASAVIALSVYRVAIAGTPSKVRGMELLGGQCLRVHADALVISLDRGTGHRSGAPVE
jgi:hypothetical protein